MKRIFLLLAVTALVVAMLAVGTGMASAQTAPATAVQECDAPVSINAEGPVLNNAGGPARDTTYDEVNPLVNPYGQYQGYKVIDPEHTDIAPTEFGEYTAAGPPQEGSELNCRPLPGDEPRGSS